MVENKKTLDEAVNRLMMAEGLDFMTAACRVASWEITWHVLGPEPLEALGIDPEACSISIDYGAIELDIQEILHRVFGGTETES